MKISNAKNFAIVMAMSKQFLIDYLLKSPSNGKGHHMAYLLLEVVMDKFSTLTYPNCYNFLSSARYLYVVEWAQCIAL
jgi:hypothetical protein